MESIGKEAIEAQERDRLRSFWSAQYVDFSLHESGSPRLSAEQNELYYRCKENAYRRALRAGGVEFRSKPTILDAACGQGFFAAVAQRLLPGAAYTGLDISENAIGYLRERFPNFDWTCDDLCDPRFDLGRRFRVVQTIDFPYLVVDDDIQRQAITNLAGHVEAGGTLILTDTLPKHRIHAHAPVVYRPLRHYQNVLGKSGLELVAVIPMYYCVPEVGARFSRTGVAWRMLPPNVLFAIDRIGLTLKLPAHNASHESRMKMIVFKKPIR